MRAICARCGGSRGDFRETCPACGYRADGEALLVAWLLSEGNFEPAKLDAVAERIRKGEPLRPTEAMLAKARRALGADLETDVGLTTAQRIALLLGSLVLTPLPAYVAALWWWQERPRAAVQALALGLPASAGFAAFWVWAMFG